MARVFTVSLHVPSEIGQSGRLYVVQRGTLREGSGRNVFSIGSSRALPSKSNARHLLITPELVGRWWDSLQLSRSPTRDLARQRAMALAGRIARLHALVDLESMTVENKGSLDAHATITYSRKEPLQATLQIGEEERDRRGGIEVHSPIHVEITEELPVDERMQERAWRHPFRVD